jgi:hypothetical protein
MASCLPKAKEDLIWLTDRATNLADMRNNAVYAPCSLIVDPDGISMAAAY